MADATPDTATPDISGLTPDQLGKYIAMLHLGQGLPNVQPDQTPVDTSGFWGGLRHGISLLGEAAGSPGPETLKALSPKEREQAGLQSLSRFGTGLLAASHYVPGQTLGSNLGQGFQAAEHGYDTTARQAMGMLAARQGYAVESQRADLEKLKAALPLLSLQQQLTGSANTQKLLSGQVTPGTNIGTGGSIAPPDPSSPAGRVATRTAAFWSSQGFTPEQVAGIMAGGPGAESGFNPGIKGDGGDSHGLYQHQGDRWTEMVKRYGPSPTEAQQNEFAAWEISPQGTYADVGAQLRAAKTPQEAAAIWTKGFERPKNADAQAAARAGVAGQYLGYGAAPSTPGQAGTPAPASLTPSAPGAKTQIPPPAVAAPGQATPPTRGATIPSEPPLLAGGAQAAGGPGAPGAPTSGVIPTLPPAAVAASAADVAQIESGMANARANPITPGAQPGAVVTAQAGGQQPTTAAQYPPIKIEGGVVIPHPGSFSEFSAREYVPPPKTEDFNPNLSEAQQKEFSLLQQGIQQRIANRPNLPIAQQQAEATKIIEDRAALQARIQAAIQDKQQKADAATTKWNDAQRDKIQERYGKEREDYMKAAAAQQVQSHKMEEINTTAAAARETEAAKQEGQYILEDRKKMAESRDAARQSIDQVHILRALSDRAGTATALENITLPNGQTIRDVMVQHGLGDEKTLAHLNGQQAYEMAATQMVMDLRKGVQMGNLSDGDLRFLQKVVPKGSVTPEGRADMLATIELIHDRKREYIDRVHQLWDQGKGLSWEKAKVEADKQMGDIVPQVPQEYNTMSDQERDVWWKANTKPRMLLRTPDELNKDGKVTRRGHLIQVPEAPQ